MTQVNRRNGNSGRSAFTLIELLVVMAIISLLIAILLPSLSGARRAGKRVTCLANLKEIGKGMHEYGQDNEDWIVGAPAGSGAYLAGASVAFGPCVQRWDFMGPLAKMWGADVRWPELDGNLQRVAERFNAIRNDKIFLCPGNDWLATHFSGPNAGVGPMISYNTSRNFLFQRDPFGSDPNGLSWYGNQFEEKLPANWKPSVNRVGDASRKVFCGDGARYSTGDQPPDYDLELQGSWGGAFADSSPFTTFSRSWERSWAPGNAHLGQVDSRGYAFRHASGVPSPGAKGNAYRGNFVFFDGHSETLGDLDASSPWMWMPAKSRLLPDAIHNDTRAHFGINGTVTIDS